MKTQPCPTCNGTQYMRGWLQGVIITALCDICDGTGTLPDEEVSHCAACGEPVELGLEWCEHHRPAADLWQVLNESN